MKIRTAKKIMKAIEDYVNENRLDMPYNGLQVYNAAKVLLPISKHCSFKGWHSVTKSQGRAERIANIKQQ